MTAQQQIDELEACLQANDERMQKREALNSELLAELKYLAHVARACGWHKSITAKAYAVIAKAEALK